MATRTTCHRQEPRASLANPATMIVVAMITAMTFSASGAAPTPLYQLYQEHFGLTPALVTIIFAAYVLCLLLALLTTGALSDYVGRRPIVLGALMLNIIAMVLFISAGSGAALIAAQAMQGFATGVATAALGAAILDVDQRRGPVLNSVTVFAGLTVGTLGAATLVTFAPDPAQLVYVVLLTLSGIEALLIWYMPETAQTKPGALTSLRPHVSIPIQARQTLAQLTPVTFSSWALSGFYFSLMPALVRAATGATLPIVGGLVVAALTFSSVIAILALLTVPADRVLLGAIPALALGVAITLWGVHAQFVAVMLLGTMVSGVGFGAVFSGTLRTVLPLAQADERAGLLSAFYLEGYLAFSLPAVLTGFLVPIVGLALAADVYGAAVILMAVASLVAIGVWLPGADDRLDRVEAAINGLNHQKRSFESIHTCSRAGTLAFLGGASPVKRAGGSHGRRRDDEGPHTEERIREWPRRDHWPQWRIVDRR